MHLRKMPCTACGYDKWLPLVKLPCLVLWERGAHMHHGRKMQGTACGYNKWLSLGNLPCLGSLDPN